MSKSYDKYPPLELLKAVNRKFPTAWVDIEDFHNNNGKEGLPRWPEWCYAPMAASMAIVTDEIEKSLSDTDKQLDTDSLFPNSILYSFYTQQVAALAVWRKSKEVFVFDKDMEQLLDEQDEVLSIPSEILLQLPYPCFYIQLNNLIYNGKKYHGFFAHLEYDININSPGLRLLFLADDLSTFGYPVHLDTDTIEESIQKTVQEAYQNLSKIKNDNIKEQVRQNFSFDATHSYSLIPILRKALQAILYVCAANTDVQPDQEQKTVTKRSSTGVIRDRYAEIRKWDVGVRVGSSVRRYRKTHQAETIDIEEKQTEHSKKRPHIRRGHWHHYWTGKKAVEEDRKLILKWTSPIYVGIDDLDDDGDNPAVIHNVRS